MRIAPGWMALAAAGLILAGCDSPAAQKARFVGEWSDGATIATFEADDKVSISHKSENRFDMTFGQYAVRGRTATIGAEGTAELVGKDQMRVRAKLGQAGPFSSRVEVDAVLTKKGPAPQKANPPAAPAGRDAACAAIAPCVRLRGRR